MDSMYCDGSFPDIKRAIPSKSREGGRPAKALRDLVVAIKGGGDLATGIAWRLYRSNIRRVYILEVPKPLAVRRTVTFCEAVYDGAMTVEGVTAARVESPAGIEPAWAEGLIPVLVDPAWNTLAAMPPDVVVDAIVAKRNLGTHCGEAPLVIGLGPGFEAGRDVHAVIETHRGHTLGRLITKGRALPNTGIPGAIGGYDKERVLRAPVAGIFRTIRNIGDKVAAGESVGEVNGVPVVSAIAGVLRGLIRDSAKVSAGLKLGDVDPRGKVENCAAISEKSLAMGGAVLEAVLMRYNR